MIKMRLKDMLDTVGTLRGIASKELRGRAAYNIAKIMKQVDNEFTLFNEARQKVVDKYGEKDENGNLKINADTNEYIFADKNLEAVTKEINEILDSEVELNANKLTIDDLEDLKLTPTEMASIIELIEE